MRLSFRAKILVALVVLAGGVTAAALLVAERTIAAMQRTSFDERFASDIGFVAALQTARLGLVRSKCLELARSVRLIAAIHEEDLELLYQIALDELRDVMNPPPGSPRVREATFFRLLDAAGHVLPATDPRAGLLAPPGGDPPRWERQLAAASTPRADEPVQEVGYVAPDVGGEPALHEVVLTRIVDQATGRVIGALVFGFPAQDVGGGAGGLAPIRMGLWLEGHIYSHSIPAVLRPRLTALLAERLERVAAGAGDTVDVDGVPHRLFARRLATAPTLPDAYQIGLYSLAEPLAAARSLRATVLGLGLVALVVALAASLQIAHGLTEPVGALVRGAHEIRAGNYDVRIPSTRHDEIGRLATAFNDMAAGLALKERYRRVLDLVADRHVADELLSGQLALGGELRDVSVLVCDICGFTTLTESMAPSQVIALLNEHMTALTAVVYTHGGVVDKFIGDGLMAVFGAPKSTGRDAEEAVATAREMLVERARLNRDAAHPMDVHVGVASGTVVVGCMGSTNRLDYTVVGARVNLAFRLCAQAGAMEIVIDDLTRERLGAVADAEPLPPLSLKGFRRAVAAYRLGGQRARKASP